MDKLNEASIIVCVGCLVMDLTDMTNPHISEYVEFEDAEVDYVYPRWCAKCHLVDFSKMLDPLALSCILRKLRLRRDPPNRNP